MSSPSATPNPQLRLLELVTELQLVEPTPAAVTELESLLQSPGSRRLYLELTNIQGHLQTLHTQRAPEEMSQPLDVDEILAVLRQAEDAAPDYYVASQDHSALPPAPVESDDRPAMTLSKVTSAATYLLRQHVTPRHLALAGIAAVLLLGLTVFFALQGGKTSSPTDTTPFTQTPGPDFDRVPVDRVQRSVATLTAQHNATWSEGAFAPGSALHPNQRLTLTAGFAEITTSRGAVAILEAPATIELLDNNNALRLHTGKLVGICETESSKGFLVRTPHMDVTDLGTEFGVEVRGSEITATVITGEIEVVALADATEQRLIANQTARLSGQDLERGLVVEDRLANGFKQLLPRVARVQSLRNDPAMIAYYGFEADDLVDGKVLNRATATLGKMDGTLGQEGKPDSKPTLTDGRRPGTDALRFSASEYDLIRVDAADARVLDGLEQFTIGLWVRPGNTDCLSHHLITQRKRGSDIGLNIGLAWKGRPAVGYPSNAVFFDFALDRSSPAGLSTAADTLERHQDWMHLVVTYERNQRSVYLNGALIERLPKQAPERLSADADLLIGAQAQLVHLPASYLDGDMDELFILGRAMSPGEITTLYETGVAKP